MSQQALKQLAGQSAADASVTSGMVVGLGTGSTAIWAVRRIAERITTGDLTDVVGVPTSQRTADEARQLGIPLTTLMDHPRVDVTIDGADEVDNDLNLIKGGGGALLREKIVAQASDQLVIVVDASKLSPRLGTGFRLPVEVIPFGVEVVRRYVMSLGAQTMLRRADDGNPYTTDNGNYILDCDFSAGIADVHALASQLGDRAGVVEHGLFIQLATQVIVADAQGIHTLHQKTK